MVAPQYVGLLSDWFAGTPCDGCGLAAARAPGPRAHRLLGGIPPVACVPHHRRGPEARHRLHTILGLLESAMAKATIDRRWLPLNALRAFEGVAKHGSFTAAANALLISQSALSRHVIALEKLIGVQLFERRPHVPGIDQGRTAFAAGGHEVVRSARVRTRRHPQRGARCTLRTLRVQMPPSFAAHLAVPILRDFRRRRCRGGDRSGQSLRRRVRRSGDVDVAVVYSKPTVTDLVTDLLWPVRLSRAVSSEHRGALAKA